MKLIEAEHGRVGALVNNAGYGEYGTIEETDLDKVRTMFETNVFGLARLTQLVLPAMREARSGRVVNVGSMGGRFTFPVGGYYHATKYAVEAITDALRNEVRGFGIGVSLVEPGLIRTGFEQTALTSDAAATQGIHRMPGCWPPAPATPPGAMATRWSPPAPRPSPGSSSGPSSRATRSRATS